MLQAVKQSTLGARDLSCAVFGFGQVFVGSGTPTLSFIAPQNSNVRRPSMSCLNPLRKYFSLRVHVTLRSKRCVESEPDRFPQRFPQARTTLLVGGFSGKILFTKKSSDSLTKVIPSLHVILLAVRDRQ